MRSEFGGGNLLVGGATKQGKTSFLKEMIADYLENKTSDEMEIIVLDTKGAGEYDEFAEKVRIYKNFIEIASVLTSLVERIRAKEDGESQEKKICLFIDEYGDMVPGEYMDEKARAFLISIQVSVLAIAKNGCSRNISLTLATNRINQDVLTDDLLDCFPQRVCFRVATATESAMIFPGFDAGAELLNGGGEMLVQYAPESAPVFSRENLRDL